MRTRNCVGMVALAIVTAWPFGGCTQVLPTTPVEFGLGQGLGDFTVTAGVPDQKSRRVTLNNTSGLTIGRGTLGIDPSAISFTPAATGGGKIQVTQQGTNQVVVTAWVGTIDELETVFDAGDEYGPYTVTLDAQNVPVSVSPAWINLTAKTVGLLNDGEFSLGLRVESTIDGSITIESVIFNLGL